MKKAFSFMITLVMLLSLFACNGSSVSSGGDSSDAGTSSSDVSSEQASQPQAGVSQTPDNNTPASSTQKPSGTQSKPNTQPPASSQAAVSSQPVTSNIVSVTIPEGYSVSQITALLETKGVCTQQKLLDTINSYDFTYYPLIGALTPNSHRCFKLEGYLYPNTYQFYVNQKPQDVIGVFLRGSENKITAADRSRAAELGYSVDQIITMASIIQKETSNSENMKNVASVFYNRLKSGMQLDADPTITYIESYVKPLINGDNRYNSYYNTYKCPALPAGPICNPGRAALNAALYPNTTEYLFFVCKDGTTLYAKTYEEHKANCATLGITTGT